MQKERHRTVVLRNMTKKKPFFFGIQKKTGLLIMLLTLSVFYIALTAAGIMHLFIAIADSITGDFMIGRVVARSMEQGDMESVLNDGWEAYNSIPEEMFTDPLDIDYQARYEQMTQTDVYKELFAMLTDVAKESDVAFINVVIYDKDTGRVINLVDTETPREDRKYNPGYWRYVSDMRNTYFDPLGRGFDFEYFDRTGLRDLVLGIYTDGDIYNQQFCTYAPFYSTDRSEVLGFIGVGEVWSEYEKETEIFRAAVAVLMIGFTAVFAVIAGLVVHFTLVKPIRNLTDAARRYSRAKDKIHDNHYFSNLNIRTHDEISILAEAMAGMEQDITGYINGLTAATAENERISTELGVAEKIQLAMLPDSLEGSNVPDSFEISSYIRPAREVGGDFYDYFMIDEEHLGITIADVSGKGVPAALFMVKSMTLIKNTAMTIQSPAEIIERVNNQLCDKNSENMFATVWFGIYSISDGSLRYVNAGHEYPYIYRADTGSFDILIEDHDVVLGFFPDTTFTERELTLYPGDRLFEYTDGVPEATTSDEEMYGIGRLSKKVNSIADKTGTDFLGEIIRGVDAFVGVSPQFDDISMLLLEIKNI